MHLVRAAGDLTTDLEGVRFPMKDEDARKPISCLVTFEYLQVRSGVRTLDPHEMIGEFEIYRAEIESLASDKYDLGEDHPRVTETDLPS